MAFSRIYFSLISLAILGWVFLWNVKLSPQILIPATVTLLFYLVQYKKYGRDYIVELINSNLFSSLFLLSWPCIYFVVILADKNLNFYEKLASSYVVSTVSIFIFSALWGVLITFFPSGNKANPKITIQTRLVFLLKLLGVLYITCLFVFN